MSWRQYSNKQSIFNASSISTDSLVSNVVKSNATTNSDQIIDGDTNLNNLSVVGNTSFFGSIKISTSGPTSVLTLDPNTRLDSFSDIIVKQKSDNTPTDEVKFKITAQTGDTTIGGKLVVNDNVNFNSSYFYTSGQNITFGKMGVGIEENYYDTIKQNTIKRELVNNFEVKGKAVIGSTYAGTHVGSSLGQVAPDNGLLVQGNVGIGTDIGKNTLDVYGKVMIGTSIIGDSAPANGLAVQGQVGIGTFTPQNTLDVAGNVIIGDTWAGANSPDDKNSNDKLLVKGDVGIGTFNPTDKLHVIGNTLISKNTDGTKGNLTVEGNTNVDGNTNINGNTNVVGDLTIDGNVTVKGEKTLLETQRIVLEDSVIVVGNTTSGFNHNKGVRFEHGNNINSGFFGYQQEYINDENIKKYFTFIPHAIENDEEGTELGSGGIFTGDRGTLDIKKITHTEGDLTITADDDTSADVIIQGGGILVNQEKNGIITIEGSTTGNVNIQGGKGEGENKFGHVKIVGDSDLILNNNLTVNGNTITFEKGSTIVNTDTNTLTITENVVKFDSTGALIVPVGNNTLITDGGSGQKPSGIEGMIRYNTILKQFEGFNWDNDAKTQGTWKGLGGVIDGDQDTKIVAEDLSGTYDDHLRFYTGNGTDNSTENLRMVIDNNGNVGIGTDDPQSTLEIDGTLDVSGDTTIDTNLTVGNNSDNTTQIIGKLTVGVAAAAATEESAAVLGIDGVAQINGTLDVTDKFTVGTTDDAANTVLNGTLDVTDTFTVGTDTVPANTVLNGKIGVGTSIPRSTFDINSTDALIIPVGNNTGEKPSGVEGMIRFNNELKQFEGFNIDTDEEITSKSSSDVTIDGNDISFNGTDFITGNYTINTVKNIYLFIDDINSGIYIISWSYLNSTTLKMTLSSPVNLTGSTKVTFKEIVGTWKGLGGVIDIDKDTKILAEKTDDEDKLRFYTAGPERMIIDNEGKIGVGISAPRSTFDINSTDALIIPVGNDTLIGETNGEKPSGVQGMIRYNTDLKQFEGFSIDSGNSGTWKGLGGVIDIDQDTKILAEKTADEDKLRFYTADVERMIIDNEGNVGIGTTENPSSKLQVNGTITTNGGMKDTDGDTKITLEDNLNVRVTTSGDKFYIDGILQDTLELREGTTYIFDQSDSSNSSHPLKFSTTADGTHGGGTEYTTNIVVSGTAGTRAATVTFTVPSDAPQLYYYCKNTAAMGGTANTNGSDIDRIRMYTAGAQRMIIKENGNVGIGNTSPDNPLDIKDTITTGHTLAIRKDCSNTWTTDGGAHILLMEDGDVANRLAISFDNGHGDYGVGKIQCARQSVGGLHLCLQPAGGNVGIGVVPSADSTTKLEVAGSISSSYNTDTLSYFGRSAIGGISDYSDHAYFSHIDMASGSGNYALLQNHLGVTILNAAADKYIYFRINNTTDTQAYFDDSGTFHSLSFNATSDLRLKENIKPLENSLNKICSLEGIEFNFKNNKNKMIGFIAQDVEKIVPEVVTTANDENEYKSLAYGNVTALLVEAVKELREEVKTLRQEIKDLKGV